MFSKKKWQTDSRVILLCIYIEHFLHTYKANHTVQNNDKKRRFTPDSTKTNYKLTSHYSIIVHNKCSYQIYFTSFNFRSREVRYDESTVCLNRFWQILWQFLMWRISHDNLKLFSIIPRWFARRFSEWKTFFRLFSKVRKNELQESTQFFYDLVSNL